MRREFFGKKSELGKILGRAIYLKNSCLSNRFPISQISQFLLTNPNFRKFYEATYTNYQIYISYFKNSTNTFPFSCFSFDVFFMGNLGNWEMCIQNVHHKRFIYSQKYSQFHFFPIPKSMKSGCKMGKPNVEMKKSNKGNKTNEH